MNEQRPEWTCFVNSAGLESTGAAEATSVLERKSGFEPAAGDEANGEAGQVAAGPCQTRRRKRPETRAQLLDRLVNPQISLHEASVLLKVCPATVRSYTRSGRLPDLRTPGGQRRFRFRDVMLLARELDHKK
jgi:excisionase family DNA binding protein